MARTQTSDEPPPPSGSVSAPSNPIGVPFYTIDPATGESTGERWGVPGVGKENRMGVSGQLEHGGSYQTKVLPRYFNGSQYVPGGLSPEEIANLQKAMIDSGVLSAGEAQTGVWDKASVAAYEQLLAEANQSGTDVMTALKNRIATKKSNPQGQKGLGLQIQLTNDTDLDATFRDSYMKLTGMAPSQADVDKMIHGYHNVETMTQTASQQIAARAAETEKAGGTSTESSIQAPSAQNFSEDQIRKEHPGQVSAQEFTGSGGLADTFSSVLAKWSQ